MYHQVCTVQYMHSYVMIVKKWMIIAFPRPVRVTIYEREDHSSLFRLSFISVLPVSTDTIQLINHPWSKISPSIAASDHQTASQHHCQLKTKQQKRHETNRHKGNRLITTIRRLADVVCTSPHYVQF